MQYMHISMYKACTMYMYMYLVFGSQILSTLSFLGSTANSETMLLPSLFLLLESFLELHTNHLITLNKTITRLYFIYLLVSLIWSDVAVLKVGRVSTLGFPDILRLSESNRECFLNKFLSPLL